MEKKLLLESSWKKGITYPQYRDLMDDLLSQGKTTGENHSEEMLNYTQLNRKRMAKWDKHLALFDEARRLLVNLRRPERWLVITEAWCGDAAHNIPPMVKMADNCSLIDLRVVLRDENPELIDAYLTNGGRSIPKLIRFTEDYDELGSWGPRPQKAQELFDQLKNSGKAKEDINIALQKWYAQDKGENVQQELAAELAMYN